MRSVTPPPALKEFASVLASAGWRCYLVGGAVRDYLIGRPVSDFDAATDAAPEAVAGLFRRVAPTGIKHGTVTVLFKGLEIETTTFRTEAEYGDGRHPDAVAYASTIEEDLARRDFTMNAMAWDLVEGGLVDPHEGRADLGSRLIRAVGVAADRFREDGLRPLRALRFATQLGFEIEAATYAAIPASLDRFALVSAERVRDELSKMLLSPRPSRGLALMEECGMLGLVLPELAACRGVEQRGMHRLDVLDHSLLAMDAAEPELVPRLAALLHDVGKPEAKEERPGGDPTFYRHEEISARLAEAALKRLRFPNAVVHEAAHLVRHHMFAYDDSWTDTAVRRFLARVGPGNVGRLLALRIADGSAIAGAPVDPRSLEGLRRRIEAVLEAKQAFGIKDLALGGEELAAIGVPRGPIMGRMLAELLETVLDDPALNERERLLEIAERMKGKYGLS